jgi:hemerythrin-like domain-containing protein
VSAKTRGLTPVDLVGMSIQIGSAPDHDFDEPLGLLSDCHRRIEHFLDVLIATERHAAGGPLTSAQRGGLEASVRYFAISAPKHTADEEQSLFPRLRTVSDSAVAHALELLEHDHDEAEQHHTTVDQLVQQWLAHNTLDAAEAETLREHLTALRHLYQQHIRIEDRDVFPAAARLLSATQIHEVGREMAERRMLRVASTPLR